MKRDIEIWNENTKGLSWGETQLCQLPALKSMQQYCVQELISFKKWYDSLTPAQKCSVWSESGE